MGGIVFQLSSVLPFEEPNPLLSMKPSKTSQAEEYKYAAGETRLRIELEGKPKEVIESYVKKYRELCDTIYGILKDLGIGQNDEKKFIIETSSILYSTLNLKHLGRAFIYDFFDKIDTKDAGLDCDTSAFIVFDVGRRLEICGLEIVDVPGHSFIRTEKYGFETTFGSPEDCIFPINDLKMHYPVIYMSTSDIVKMQSITYSTRGVAKHILGDYKGAIDDFNKSIRLNPACARDYSNLGCSKNELGDFEDSIADFNEAIRRNPDDSDAYYNRASSKLDLGNHKGAIADYDEAIRLNPEHYAAFFNRGFVKFELGDYKGAIVDYGKSLKLDPKYADSYYFRALARERLGDLDGFDEDMKMYGKLKSDQ